ncbi:winged helix-turn-helix domain-containing protein [Thaumasiovibrio sp. DFM-14]|uniref:winged helix-turn-helix domain-containing protein n=1 Tax=Thaumasiovibrio sp. DFM-14 TaxID=3384792 RepID=UPI0039A203DA
MNETVAGKRMNSAALCKSYQFADVYIDLESNKLLWDSGSYTLLSQLESSIMDLLCYHGGEVISYSVLERVLSNAQTYNATLTLEQHIRNLNTKLAPSNSLSIHHVFDFGYRIPPPLPENSTEYHHRSVQLPAIIIPTQQTNKRRRLITFLGSILFLFFV